MGGEICCDWTGRAVLDATEGGGDGADWAETEDWVGEMAILV